jgi:protein-L-isoaspartate(D-aspartate) O-methyltransferase
MPDYLTLRRVMVESQVRTNDVTDTRVQDAMAEVPRERFVPQAKRALAYADAVVEVAPGRFLLDPRTFSKLAQLAEIEPTDRILDVACASGYSTAVLAKLGGHVTALEEDAELVRIASDTLAGNGARAQIVQGRLADGYPPGAPYDVIFVNGAVEQVPETLTSQLAEGGRLVAIVQQGPQGRAQLLLREHSRIGAWTDFDATVPLLPGFRKARGFVF